MRGTLIVNELESYKFYIFVSIMSFMIISNLFIYEKLYKERKFNPVFKVLAKEQNLIVVVIYTIMPS